MYNTINHQMTELINILLKIIKDTEGLMEIRNDIRKKITELKNDFNDENDNLLTLLNKKYYNISNKINYINNKEMIIEHNKDRNKQYIKDHYEEVKEYNRTYQKNKRKYYKDIERLLE